MTCRVCGSEKQRSFPVDIKIYYDKKRTAAPSAFMLDVMMCLDCGVSEFVVPGGWNELQHFAERGE